MSFRAPMFVVIALIGLATIVLVALGAWQLQRHQWKQDIVAERDARTAAAPVDVALLLDAPRAEADWRRVEVSGFWDNDRTMVVANRVRFGTLGEEAVTPLRLGGDGPAVLVDRGWFPVTERSRVLAALASESTGEVEGLARAVGNGDGHVIPNGAWNRIDALAMGASLPYATLPWVVLEGRLVAGYESDGGVLPVRQYLAFANTTPHLEYALTWFGLAIVLNVVAVFRFVIAPRRAVRRSRRAPPPSRSLP